MLVVCVSCHRANKYKAPKEKLSPFDQTILVLLVSDETQMAARRWWGGSKEVVGMYVEWFLGAPLTAHSSASYFGSLCMHPAQGGL